MAAFLLAVLRAAALEAVAEAEIDVTEAAKIAE